MRLSNIQIKNFKTFRDVSISLNDANILIGACASGKSNFVEIFEFFKDFSENFKKAYNMHGRFYLQNLKSQNQPSFLKCSFEDVKGIDADINEKLSLNFTGFSYEICVNFKDDNYEILSEIVEFNYNHNSSQNSLYIKNINGVFTANLKKDEYLFTVDDLIPSSLLNFASNNFKLHNIPLINSPLSVLPIPWQLIVKDINCYNFNPQFSKNFSKINGDSRLLKFGENLATILNDIFKNKDDKRKFLNLVNDLLPYVNDIEVYNVSDNQLFYSIFEENKSLEFPSLFISDGTSNVIALIVALFFDNSQLLLIEEPERNIHPALLSNLVEMIEEASKFKQIILTSHSPEMLKFMDLDNVFLIYKDLNGFSNISKPVDNESVMPFIDEFGIDEVFKDNYLELGND